MTGYCYFLVSPSIYRGSLKYNTMHSRKSILTRKHWQTNKNQYIYILQKIKCIKEKIRDVQIISVNILITLISYNKSINNIWVGLTLRFFFIISLSTFSMENCVN